MVKTQVALRRLILVLGMAYTAGDTIHGQIAPKVYESIPKSAYSVVAEVHAKPGKVEELRKATLPLIELVRNDPKNLVYFFQVDRSDPGHLIFYEIFATEADFEAHNNMPYVKAWFAKLPSLADGNVKVLRMEVLRPPSR